MAYDIVLHPTVLSTFGITQIHKHISSGQRQVYIVEAQGKTAVIKIMSTIAADRLSRELDVYKRFAGKPGLPVLIDIKAIEGKIVLLEEYIPGHNLQEVASKYTNDESKVKELLKSIITIMLPIWEANLVHRDIKPENIIIKPDDAPVLIDFGIVKDFNSDSVTEAGSQPLWGTRAICWSKGVHFSQDRPFQHRCPWV
jgi:serine/threonine protein kinase